MSWSSISTGVCAAIDRAAAAYKIRPKCESPIEIDLAAALLVAMEQNPLAAGLTLQMQFKFEKFRVDIALLRAGRPVLFIECDGADFHSTPEQIANDRRKDAAALAAGIRLIRFTGRKIFQDPDLCAIFTLRCLP